MFDSLKSWSILFVIALLTALFGYLLNLPQNVGDDVPEGKLSSLSFAPFREGQGPVDGVFPSPAEMDEDLALMAKTTHNIRTYASAEGHMPALPALAKKHGLTMLQGAWLGSTDADNQREIQALITAANTYPDVIKRVIVGNEVLLRGDLKPEQLIPYIRQVRQAIKQPVSYADVWSEYRKHPQLIKEVDFVTIHILPYWEDEPIDVKQAPAHIERIYKQVQKQAYAMVPGIPILIGESGWPGAGRQRGLALPSVVNEARFIRGFIQVANRNGFDYNIVEAINQSWKSQLEGDIGANWGLFSVDRKAVFPLTGPVYEDPQWFQVTGVAIGLFLALAAGFWRPLQQLNGLAFGGFLILLQALVYLWVNDAEHLWYTSYSHWQRLQTLILLALTAAVAVLGVQRLYALLLGQQVEQRLNDQWAKLYAVMTLYAIFKTFCLAYNGRYINFPNPVLAVPLLTMLALVIGYYVQQQSSWSAAFKLKQWLPVHDPKGYAAKLGMVLVLLGLLLPVGETYAFVVSRDFIADHPAFVDRLGLALAYTFGNPQLVMWLLSIGIMALPLLVTDRQKAA